MKPTDIRHRTSSTRSGLSVGLSAHTPVPEYIRLIAAGRYSDAYMVNWKSMSFPELGRTCDRLPACRRVRGKGQLRSAA